MVIKVGGGLASEWLLNINITLFSHLKVSGCYLSVSTLFIKMISLSNLYLLFICIGSIQIVLSRFADKKIQVKWLLLWTPSQHVVGWDRSPEGQSPLPHSTASPPSTGLSGEHSQSVCYSLTLEGC